MSLQVDMVRELTIKPLYVKKDTEMVNALNSGVIGLSNKAIEMDGMKLEKKQNSTEVSKEESKVEKLKKSIESGDYKLDMEKTAKALVEF